MADEASLREVPFITWTLRELLEYGVVAVFRIAPDTDLWQRDHLCAKFLVLASAWMAWANISAQPMTGGFNDVYVYAPSIWASSLPDGIFLIQMTAEGVKPQVGESAALASSQDAGQGLEFDA
eukprot:TRINITY_DN53836_c0_g1_i1.p1 TRINITY_DN53836_c0_g1~~TRINITY_DN53836_c0_g1_i1.p1  ORF type:complete len:130 (+),score=12.95 TRINITY_DN53836_c0_g1_i1:22-390(+)